jgi:hypothetical protein
MVVSLVWWWAVVWWCGSAVMMGGWLVMKRCYGRTLEMNPRPARWGRVPRVVALPALCCCVTTGRVMVTVGSRCGVPVHMGGSASSGGVGFTWTYCTNFMFCRHPCAPSFEMWSNAPIHSQSAWRSKHCQAGNLSEVSHSQGWPKTGLLQSPSHSSRARSSRTQANRPGAQAHTWRTIRSSLPQSPEARD